METDLNLGQKILDSVNASRPEGISHLDVDTLPHPDGKDIFVLHKNLHYYINGTKAQEILKKYGIPTELLTDARKEGDTLDIGFETAEKLGLYLIPYLSYGVLNGGMATSYCDRKNNSAFNPELFAEAEKQFEALADTARNIPKGATPAYINPDGTPGYDFMALKLRSILLTIKKSMAVTGKGPDAYRNSVFQMTSNSTDTILRNKYRTYRELPGIRDLSEETGVDITEVLGAVQPLIPAFTHTSKGFPLDFFRKEDGSFYSLPGGHGQNFMVLRDTYRKLLAEGKKFVYLGNVDNIGFTVSPAEVAILALSERNASFDFSFKTPVDVKGGILAREKNGRLNCGDIGRAISKEFVASHEASGMPILFNCATGLFNLEYLVENLDRIIDSLPVRLIDQHKDIGMYSQTEQITWEIIGLLESMIIFAVHKEERFIASKLLMDNILASGLECCETYLAKHEDTDFTRAVRATQKGLAWNLETQYGMKLSGGKWIPDNN